jgi:hypothetical protein
MNKIVGFFILLSVIFSFTSCQKEKIEKPDNTNTVPDNIDIIPMFINKDWVLVEAYYISNSTDTYQKHSVISNVTPQSGVSLEMDTILKDISTWRFENTRFIVDGSILLEELSPSDPKLDFNGYNTITLYFGSTTRVLEINRSRLITEGVLEITGPRNASVGGSDDNVLIFTEDGSYKDISPNKIPSTYSVDPTLISSLSNNNSSSELYGETWLVTNITSNGFTYPGTTFPYTVVFNANGTYTINGLGSPNRIYKVVNVPFQPLVDLEMYDFTPLAGGNFVIRVSLTSIVDGVIDGAVISDIYGDNTNQKRIWMNRQ